MVFQLMLDNADGDSVCSHPASSLLYQGLVFAERVPQVVQSYGRDRGGTTESAVWKNNRDQYLAIRLRQARDSIQALQGTCSASLLASHRVH